MWPQVAQAHGDNRFELIMTGPEISARLDKSGGHLDPKIFEMKNLNYLDITKTTLKYLPNTIGELNNLQSLVLNSNEIEDITPGVGNLKKLRFLDMSKNKIQGKITDRINEMTKLSSLNLSDNQIEIFPQLTATINLSVIDLTSNKLTQFPDVCRKELANLALLKLAHNKISSIPPEIKQLSNLKCIEIYDNEIETIPGELGECPRLKAVDFRDNPISDRRLLKLIDACRMKQVVDYVREHCPKVGTADPKKSAQKVAKGPKIVYRHTIRVHRSPEKGENLFRIVIDDSVAEIREHFVACLIDNLDFSDETLKKFIQIQNGLHDGICQRRNASTIATHDFDKLPPGNLVYTTLPPDDLVIHPLNRPGPVKGTELFQQLEAEANNLRQDKKRAESSGIHRYLYLIEDLARYPCLLDKDERVISFPPITNCDGTKIDSDTKRILVEVTSSMSLLTAKFALEALLKDMVNVLDMDLEVTQVRMIDRAGRLKVLFPSKPDLRFEDDSGIKIERD